MRRDDPTRSGVAQLSAYVLIGSALGLRELALGLLELALGLLELALGLLELGLGLLELGLGLLELGLGVLGLFSALLCRRLFNVVAAPMQHTAGQSQHFTRTHPHSVT